jgi:hypothetical protein
MITFFPKDNLVILFQQPKYPCLRQAGSRFLLSSLLSLIARTIFVEVNFFKSLIRSLSLPFSQLIII